MKIKKSHLLKGKRYIVIIEADKEIVEDKIYPAIFKEVHVADKVPKWFADWEKANNSKPPQWFMEFYGEFKEFKTDMLDFKTDMLDFKTDMLDFKTDMLAFKKTQMEFNENIKKDIQLIKNTPTMKRELNLK